MRRIISLVLAFSLVLSLAVPAIPASAAEPSEQYYTINVEFSDRVGQQEKLRVMVRDGHVYADAKALATRLGYTFGEDGESAAILNTDSSFDLPFRVTRFKYGSTQVIHALFNSFVDTYEAPFESVRNDEGSWIPLEYSLLLLNSGMMIADDTLLIDIPTKRIIDYFYDVATKSKEYNFDWAKDIGYSGVDVKVMGASSHLVNVFSGLLELDGASWGSMFDILSWSTASYDRKYGEDVALLMCTESDKELQATIDDVSMFIDLLSDDGKLGEMLTWESKVQDMRVGALYEDCEEVLQSVMHGNTELVMYNRSYQALEKALDKQTWFSKTGGNILKAQKSLSDAVGTGFEFLDMATKVLEVVGYGQEFAKQDTFSAPALAFYLETANDGLELPQKMRKSMMDYADSLSGFVGDYMTKRLVENVDQWVLDALPMHEILGMQAAGALFAWNLASATIPFVKNGLSGADSYELALYSLAFQNDAYANHVGKRNSVFANDEVSEEGLYELSQYCYVYLKSCYVTREAAVASLDAKSLLSKEQLQPLVERQNRINTKIAKILVELKRANETNEGLVYGFLPSDNEEYLEMYDDTQLVQWIEKGASIASESIPRKLITSFHMSYNSKESGDYALAYEEWAYATYDEQGHITNKSVTREVPFSGLLFEPEYSLNYTYDADGRLTKVSGTVGDPDQPNPGILDWTIAYEGDGLTSHAIGPKYSVDDLFIDDVFGDNGNLIMRDYFIVTGQVLTNGKLTLSYDADGRIIGQSSKTWPDGSQSSMSGYETSLGYDQANRITLIETLDSSGKLFSRRTYGYDEAGQLAYRNHFYDGGNSNLTVNQTYTYDENGHLASIDQTEGDGGWEPVQATFTTDDDGSIVSASIEGDRYTETYEVEYVTISTPSGQEPLNAVDLTDPLNPELYNELWVSHTNLGDPTPFDESAYLHENRRWLELH